MQHMMTTSLENSTLRGTKLGADAYLFLLKCWTLHEEREKFQNFLDEHFHSNANFLKFDQLMNQIAL